MGTSPKLGLVAKHTQQIPLVVGCEPPADRCRTARSWAAARPLAWRSRFSAAGSGASGGGLLLQRRRAGVCSIAPVPTRHSDCLNSIWAWLSMRLDVLARLAGDKRDRHVPHRAEGVAQVGDPFFGGHPVGHEIPLVDHEHARLVLLGDVVAKLLIDLADPLRGVEEQQHHVGPADAPLGAVRAVKIDVGDRCSCLRRKPGVSMAMNALPSSSNRTSTLSRVVPGTSLTIIRSAWAKVFTSVLLPVLRRPTWPLSSPAPAAGASSGGRLGQSCADLRPAIRPCCDSPWR